MRLRFLRRVVDDMVNEFDDTWLTEKQQDAIVDYPLSDDGPNRPRE